MKKYKYLIIGIFTMALAIVFDSLIFGFKEINLLKYLLLTSFIFYVGIKYKKGYLYSILEKGQKEIGVEFLVYNSKQLVIEYSKMFKNMNIKKNSTILEIFSKINPSQSFEEKINEIKIQDKWYQVYHQKNDGIIFFVEKKLVNVEKQTQPVFGHIIIDNYDEVSKFMSDRKKSNLNNIVTNQLSMWASDNKLYLKKIDDDRFIVFLNRKQLEKLENNKFQIIHSIREATEKQNNLLTISMGYSYVENQKIQQDYSTVAKYAMSNLELALGRGGDQVVVKSPNEEARFYGGKANLTRNRTFVRSRIISQALTSLIKESNKIMVMGHQYPDMDAIGSCLGIRRICKQLDKEIWMVTNPDQYSDDIKKLMDEVKKDIEISNSLLTPKEAEKFIDDKTLLIMVDVSKPSISAAPHLFNYTKNVVVIDHHRRGEEFPEKTVLTYIETYASSAAELITELIEYQMNKNDLEYNFKKIEATALLGGIIVDTKHFSLRTSNRTFDAASFLNSSGADMLLIQKLLKENISDYLSKTHLLQKLEIYDSTIGIILGEEDKIYPPVLAAQTADMLLSMENIEAAFVILKRDKETVGISARSLGDKNIQLIMEELGGGGHLSNAAAQLKNTTIHETAQLLKFAIERQINN